MSRQDNLKQQMLDHMNEHWAGDPPLEGQVSPGCNLDPNSSYAQWCQGQDQDCQIARELLGDDLMWDNDNNRWIVK
jgi:hypothetical protein